MTVVHPKGTASPSNKWQWAANACDGTGGSKAIRGAEEAKQKRLRITGLDLCEIFGKLKTIETDWMGVCADLGIRVSPDCL